MGASKVLGWMLAMAGLLLSMTALAADSARVQALLDAEGTGAVADSRPCISRRQISQVEPLSESLVAFIGRRSIWINRLQGPCPGLRARHVLELESGTGQLCNMQPFYGLEPMALDLVAQGMRQGLPPALVTRDAHTAVARQTPLCLLGRFTPVTEAELQELRQVLRSGAEG